MCDLSGKMFALTTDFFFLSILLSIFISIDYDESYLIKLL